MIDPISASIAAGAGARLIDRVGSAVLNATDGVASLLSAGKATAAGFDDTLADATRAAFQKLFAAHPELKAQLGDGPYTLTQNDNGSLTLSSSSSGKSILLDRSTALGQKATLLANSLELKNFQKGLELHTL